MNLEDELYNETITEILEELKALPSGGNISVFNKDILPPPVGGIPSGTKLAPLPPIPVPVPLAPVKPAMVTKSGNPPPEPSTGPLPDPATTLAIIYNSTDAKDGKWIDQCSTVIRLDKPVTNPGVEYIGSRKNLIFTSLYTPLNVPLLRRTRVYNIWVDMQESYGDSTHLKKKFGRMNPAKRNAHHPMIDYRSVNIIDEKYYKKYGPLPLELSTLLWTLDNYPDKTVVLYGYKSVIPTLSIIWNSVLQKLIAQGAVIVI